MNELEIMFFFGIRAFFALIAGLIMGIERTISGHSAGVKTLVLVSVGSSMFASLSFYMYSLYPHTDPTRIIGQIITGVGFLGAGVIFQKSNTKISGLTSSAMIWMACALGTIAGSGLFVIPVCASITLVIVIICLKKLEKFLEKYEKVKMNNTTNE